MQTLEVDFWLSGLVGLSAAMISLLLHTLFFFVPDQEPVVVTRIEFQVLESLPSLSSLRKQISPALPEGKIENDLPTKSKTEAQNVERSTMEKHTDAYGSSSPPSTDWRNRLFRPTRKTLHERNRIAEVRMEKRRVLLADTSSKTPWPKAPPGAEVAICTPQKTIPIDVNTRSVRHWAPFLPSVLFPVEYAEELQQIVAKNQKRSLGRVQRFALPKQFLQLPLDEPKDVVLLLGREDIRCALTVAFSLGTHAPFPIRLLQVPLRIVKPNEDVSLHNVDINFNDDGSFSMSQNARNSSQSPLPFQKGRIEQSRQLTATFNGWKTMVELSFQTFR